MKDEAKFIKLYNKLNPAQREAVDQIDGPVLVIAGPGTGKTQILTLRIGNILRQTDTSPDSILALTFTNSGVYSMRRRLVEIIGAAGYRVPIYTFHGFANLVIRRYPEYFPAIIGSAHALLVDQVRLLEKIIDQGKFKWLKPYGDRFYYLKPILSEIERLKKENLSPTSFKKLLQANAGKDEKLNQKNLELAKVYEEYERALREAKLYDFADMVMAVIAALRRHKDLRLRLQEEYQYVLADEHQDANQSQNDLLALLTDYDTSPNLFIVGDEKQAIFQFQGASLDNFEYFKKLYPTAKVITLGENYRSHQLILDAAHSVIMRSALLPPPTLTRLKASLELRRAGPESPIALRAFASDAAELPWVASDLQEKIKKGVPASELAVLYRDNGDARELVAELERAGIPFVISSEANVLHDSEIKKLILIFQTIHHFGDDDKLLHLLHLDLFHFSSLKIHRLASKARVEKKSLWESLAKSPIFKTFGSKLEKLHQESFNSSFSDFFGLVLHETGFIAHLLKQAAGAEKLAKLQAFFGNIKNLLASKPHFSLADFIVYLDLLEEHHLAISVPVDEKLEGVRLMTCHRAKGLEFDYIYLIKAYDGHFGGKRERRTFHIPFRGLAKLEGDKDDDDRRLFYVALTRARIQVNLSYGKTGSEGELRLSSRFIEEIDKNLVAEIAVPEVPPIEHQWQKRQYTGPKLTDQAYLNKLFFDQGLSATALNNYLDCPLKYFFINLLRVTRVQGKELIYGTAVHATLKEFFDAYREGKMWPEKKFLEVFSKKLKETSLTPNIFKETMAKGKRALGGWYQTYNKSWSREIINELAIKGVLLDPPSVGQAAIRLRGQIDKIEMLGKPNEVKVVDYKTGKPKSRNEIMGQTKTGTGDYFRQLVFYKILLENFDRGKYKVMAGELDFIEPNPSGKYKKEQFELTDDEVKNLTETIKKTASEILDLSFLRHGCGHCDSCVLWQMMGRKV
ncbi:MAG: ATP-dependent DNA helicase [Patescibacteria group bacterium]